MTTPSDDKPADVQHDTAEHRLTALLAGLPREASPPAGVWSRVLAANRARTRHRRWAMGAAAAAAVLAWGAWQTLPVTNVASPRSTTVTLAATQGVFSSGVLPEEAQDPRFRAAVQEFEAWQVAVADPRRSLAWPHAARLAVVDAVRDTEAELTAVRAALVVYGADDARRGVLLDHLLTLRALQLEQLQRARVLLDQL